jgi:hypothetical protein
LPDDDLGRRFVDQCPEGIVGELQTDDEFSEAVLERSFLASLAQRHLISGACSDRRKRQAGWLWRRRSRVA